MSTPSAQDLPQSYLEQDVGYRLIIAVVVLFSIETTAVVMRFMARRIQGTPLIWADFFIPIAYIFNIGLFVCTILLVQNGAGRHIEVVPPDQLVRFLIITHYPEPLLYLVAATLPKLAILEIYVRIFVLERVPRYITYATGCVILLNLAVNFPVICAQCTPVAALWDSTAGSCRSAQQQFLWAGIPNIVTDIVMLLLPMPVVWKLQSARRIKWGIATTFFVGGIGLVFSVLRFVGFNHPYVDGTFIAPEIVISGIVEPGVYLVSACFLTFRPLFRWVAARSVLLSTRLSSSFGAGGGGKGSGSNDMRKQHKDPSDDLPPLEHIPTNLDNNNDDDTDPDGPLDFEQALRQLRDGPSSSLSSSAPSSRTLTPGSDVSRKSFGSFFGSSRNGSLKKSNEGPLVREVRADLEFEMVSRRA